MTNSASPASARTLESASARNRGTSGRGWLRWAKLFLALLCLPACVGLTRGVYEHFLPLWARLHLALFGPGETLTWFVSGAGAFGVVAILLWRPVTVYVFAHELVHALATWLCWGKVSNFSASAHGGRVSSSKSNSFIRLAPYCVPLYAVLAAVVFLAVDTWWRPLGAQVHYFAGLLGFLYAFHVGFTLWSLRRDQPDFQPDGWLFSLVMVYLGNLAVLALLLGFIGDVQPKSAWLSLQEAFSLGWRHSTAEYWNLFWR